MTMILQYSLLMISITASFGFTIVRQSGRPANDQQPLSFLMKGMADDYGSTVNLGGEEDIDSVTTDVVLPRDSADDETTLAATALFPVDMIVEGDREDDAEEIDDDDDDNDKEEKALSTPIEWMAQRLASILDRNKSSDDDDTIFPSNEVESTFVYDSSDDDYLYEDNRSSVARDQKGKPAPPSTDTGDCSSSSSSSSSRRFRANAARSVSQFSLPDCAKHKPDVIQSWTRTPVDIAIVTHCSVDRLDALSGQLSSWTGHVSVAMFIRTDTERKVAVDWLATDCLAADGTLAVSFVYAVQPDDLYPINFLRNVALLQAKSQAGDATNLKVLLLDVDFAPCNRLYATVTQRQARFGNNVAVIVPAFESTSCVPESLPELQTLVASGQAEPFHIGSFPEGHTATNFEKYWTLVHAKQPWKCVYKVEHEAGFEPYIIMKANEVPLYDERFQGYGLNKIAHIASVAKQCSRFAVLPGVFVVARTHAKSAAWEQRYGSASSIANRKELQNLYDEFLSRLESGEEPVVSSVTKRNVLEQQK